MKHITPDVLRAVAESLTEADTRPMFGKVEYVVEKWWTSMFGHTNVACLLHHDPADPGFEDYRSTIAVSLAAQVCGEIARVVANNVVCREETDPTAEDVLDALDDLVLELAQIRVESHSKGTLIFFTTTKARGGLDHGNDGESTAEPGGCEACGHVHETDEPHLMEAPEGVNDER